MKNDDETDKALRWYIVMQILKVVAILTGFALIERELSRLVGGG